MRRGIAQSVLLRVRKVVRMFYADGYVLLRDIITLCPQLGYLLLHLRELFATGWFMLVFYVLETQDV